MIDKTISPWNPCLCLGWRIGNNHNYSVNSEVRYLKSRVRRLLPTPLGYKIQSLEYFHPPSRIKAAWWIPTSSSCRTRHLQSSAFSPYLLCGATSEASSKPNRPIMMGYMKTKMEQLQRNRWPIIPPKCNSWWYLLPLLWVSCFPSHWLSSPQ